MHFGSTSDPSQSAAAEAKPRYVYSILKPHGQSFRKQVRLLLREDYTWQVNFRFTPLLCHLPSVGPKQLCASAHLGCKYPQSGYFLVCYININRSIYLLRTTFIDIYRHYISTWARLSRSLFPEKSLLMKLQPIFC